MKKKYSLPREFAEEWIAALRSGKYEQATGVLHKKGTNKYCCLGVAGRVVKIPIKTLDSSKECIFSAREFESFSQLPEAMRDYDLNYDLSTMNDEGKTFLEIADWVVENVEFI